MIGLVWAQSTGGVIGAGGALPWRVPEDAAHFARVTAGASVVMGRRTWESLPGRYRPLPGRRNVVLTRQQGWRADGAHAAACLEDALAPPPGGGDVWVVGGARVYSAALGRADVLEVTEVDLEVDGDTRAPLLGPEWAVVARTPVHGWATSTTGLRHRFTTLRRT